MHPDFNSLTCWRGLGIFFEISRNYSTSRLASTENKISIGFYRI